MAPNTSGQPNTVSVRFRPKISAEICFGFGLSAFSSFGDSAETLFSAERGCFGQNDSFCQKDSHHYFVPILKKYVFCLKLSYMSLEICV